VGIFLFFIALVFYGVLSVSEDAVRRSGAMNEANTARWQASRFAWATCSAMWS